MNTQALDLHELANRPGYGRAVPDLIKAGAWDENRGVEPTKWRVHLEVQVIEDDTEIVTVTARSEEEAMAAAEAQLRDDPDIYAACAVEAERLGEQPRKDAA